jgi:methylated-DNA-[protein]-cysteine S-methyltransferase
MAACYDWLDAPTGRLLVVADESGLLQVWLRHASVDEAWRRGGAPLAEPLRQLAAYFAGELKSFDLALNPHGTPFQRKVWDALVEIPYGETTSYGELARRLGNPNASRAVGLANGTNPIPIIIPCHRVIGSTGKLTGYGGGLETKRWLLDFERNQVPLPFPHC